MSSDSRAPVVDLSTSCLDIDALVQSLGSEPDFQSSLRAATVLLLPTHLGSEHEGPVFPSTTQDIFHGLRDGLADTAVVDAAIRDEDYAEYSFRSDTILLPVLFVAKSLILPIVITILSNYIYNHLRNHGNKREDTAVESEIHFIDEKRGRQLRFKYKGPAGAFERVALKSLGEDESHDS